jgi:hypothetical protein
MITGSFNNVDLAFRRPPEDFGADDFVRHHDLNAREHAEMMRKVTRTQKFFRVGRTAPPCKHQSMND